MANPQKGTMMATSKRKTAVGVQDHPTLKLGLRPGDPDRPVIKFSAIRTGLQTGIPIQVPGIVDNTRGITYGLDGNDKYGVCGPTSVDNLLRTISYNLTGTQVSQTQATIFKWYKSQNPDFNPKTGAGDNGVDLQLLLEYLVKQEVIMAFAAVDKDSDDEIREATYLFLGLILGVDLETAQQAQTETGEWTYQKSAEWGGHAIMQPAFEGDTEDVITWAERVKMSPSFIKKQRQQVFVVITADHLAHPAFREGVNLDILKSEYERLTGRPFQLPTPAEPAPLA
jgi:hypothetical protein